MESEKKELTKRQTTALARRKHIIEAAAICFIEQGFHQTSMRDIAKQAGASLGNLYNHFESKSDLIAAIAMLEDDDMIEIRAVLADEKPTSGTIDSFVVAHFNYVSKPENAVLTAEITAEAMRNQTVANAFEPGRRTLIEEIERVLKSPETRVKVDVDVNGLSELLLDMIESSATRTAFSDEHEKKSALMALRAVIVNLFN